MDVFQLIDQNRKLSKKIRTVWVLLTELYYLCLQKWLACALLRNVTSSFSLNVARCSFHKSSSISTCARMFACIPLRFYHYFCDTFNIKYMRERCKVHIQLIDRNRIFGRNFRPTTNICLIFILCLSSQLHDKLNVNYWTSI